jgi:hypothetical protein
MANFWDADPVAGSSQSGGPNYAEAIGNIESRSDGGYRAVGPAVHGGDRALGKYQVMASNVRPWSREILGREVTPQEFMSNTQLQDQIFQGKFGQYVQKYGPDGAARAWFAGEGGMNDLNRRDVLGTSVADYSRKFNREMDFAGQPASRNDLPPMIATGQSMPQQVAPAASAGNWWDADPVADQQAQTPTATPSTSGRPRVVIDTNKIGQSEQQPTGGGQDRGVLDATARGAAQGLTANFGDEIRGLVEAGGANPDDPASVYKLISGALQYFGGDAEAKKRYDEATARERGLNTAAEEQHPVASTVGGIGGALALPLGIGANAATLPGRMAAGAGVGAGLGAASGAGEGSGALDRTSRAITGAGIGGALGGAAPAAIEGVVRGARAMATPVANAVRGVRDVDSEAARRVVGALQRDQALDPQAARRLNPNEFAASVQSGGPANIMDLGGETTRALARSAANTSPEGRAVLNRGINDRFEGQTDRVTGWLRNAFHFPNADAQREALQQTARTVNRARYAQAYRDGDRAIISPELERLLGSPAVVQAVRRASTSGGDRAITQGFGAFNPGVTIENDVVRFNRGPTGAPTYPNLAFWDSTKRELDDAANAAARAGRNGEAGVLTDLARTLRGELDAQVPAYANARAGAAHFFGAQDALEAGQNFVARNMRTPDARRALSQMSPTERQLFQDGFVSRYIETLNQTGDRRSILNKIAESPAAREKLNVALGRERAEELEAGLRVEGIMDLARNAVQGNSTTARQLAELGLAGGTYTVGTGGNVLSPSPSALFNAALVYGAARGKGVINERLSRRVAEMLASNDPQILLRGIRTVTRNQNLFNSLRAADRGLARLGGENAPSSVFPAVGVSRADDQPDEPRPSGQ